jgi:hypothetical protein
MPERHEWTKCDDVIALYVYKYGTAQLGLTHEQIAEHIGVSAASLTMRVSNFRSEDIGTGLPNVAQQTRVVLREYGSWPEPELRAKAKKCLDET